MIHELIDKLLRRHKREILKPLDPSEQAHESEEDSEEWFESEEDFDRETEEFL